MENEKMEQETRVSSAGFFKDPRKRNVLIIAVAAVLLVAAVVLVITLGGKKDDANDGGLKEKESGWQIGDSGTTGGSESTSEPTGDGLGNAGANTEGGYGELIRP